VFGLGNVAAKADRPLTANGAVERRGGDWPLHLFSATAIRRPHRLLSALHVGLAPDICAKSASHWDRRHSVAAPRL